MLLTARTETHSSLENWEVLVVYVTRSIDVTSVCSSFLTAGHETKEFHQISKLWDSQPLVVKVVA